MNKRRKHRRVNPMVWALLVLGLCAGAAVWVYQRDNRAAPDAQAADEPARGAGAATDPSTKPIAGGSVTFNRDIAPIVHAHCASCHHDGGQAPFPLVTFFDVQKRATLIAKVTAKRYMPPWLPEHGVVEYVGERRLSDEQIALLHRFAAEGAPEGEGKAPRPPTFSDTWQLGEPDLVVRMPLTYMLPSEGSDVYRNFVLPVTLAEGKWIRAVEMQPGSKSVVHHAFVMLDNSGTARRLDAWDPELGYPGMNAGDGVGGPPGHFLSWQPGKTALLPPPGLQWRLEWDADVVLQLHMRPTGKPEPIQPSVAFYYADSPPTRGALALLLRSVNIEIPAGAKDYVVESTYVLPVDVEATAILPHVHYLGRELMAWCELPDGTKKWLLLIRDWDFNWQGDYQFKTPIKLPRGTRVSMRYTFDNSAENPRNPNNPPIPVRYGLNSTDEMAELWLQVVTDNPRDYAQLVNDYTASYAVPDEIARAKKLIERAPDDGELHLDLAIALMKGKHNTEARQHLDKALSLQPQNTKALFTLGVLKAGGGDGAGAIAAFEQTIALDPAHFRALNNLGFMHLQAGNWPGAEAAFIRAARVNPTDVNAQMNLGRVYAEQKKFDQSIEALERAVKLDPNNPAPREWLNRARAAQATQR